MKTLQRIVISCLTGICLLAAGPMMAAQKANLAEAARTGDRDAFLRLLAGGADVNATQGDGMTALHWSARRDDLDLVRTLIEAEADVHATTRLGGYTPLMFAARNGNSEIIAALLDAGARVDAATTNGTTPLMFAAASGSVEAVETLMAAGAEVNATENGFGQTALMFAAAYGRDGVIPALMAHGADPATTTQVLDASGNPIDQSGRSGQGESSSRGVDTLGGLSALLLAAREGHTAAVQALLDGGADVNQVSPGDHTSPLMMAVINGHFDLAKMLLERGADPNLANSMGGTPLYAVVNLQWAPTSFYPQPDPGQQQITYLELMQALIDRGADPNVRLRKKLWFTGYTMGDGVDATGATPFWRAAESSDLAAMKLLVAAGADPNIPNQNGVTPLHVAAGVGWDGNYNVNVPGGWMPTVRYLVEELGADVNAIDRADGYSALHGAASRGDNEMILYLVAKGARVDVVSTRGETVADMANGPRQRIQPFPETVALLVSLGARNSNRCISC